MVLAVWVLTAVLAKIPAITKIKNAREFVAFGIGIIAVLAGYFTGLFIGHWLLVISIGIIALAVAQIIYNKVIKIIVEKILSNK